MTKLCWCGKPAEYTIKNKLPGIEIVTYTCLAHKNDTFNAIKWKLVSDGTWIPGALTYEVLNALERTT